MHAIAAHVGNERDVEIEGWDNIVKWRTLLSADRTPSAAMTIGSAEIAPGSSVDGALHHHADHEAYYFIAGTGQVHLDGVEHPVEAGSIVFVPGGTRHFVRNTGAETLKLLYVFAVDQFSDVEYKFET
jgi:mannose-6-phosphate isomerase-like protein (cupin superfamily)